MKIRICLLSYYKIEMSNLKQAWIIKTTLMIPVVLIQYVSVKLFEKKYKR